MDWLPLSVGIFVRLLLIGVPGFKADVAFWKGWGLAVADHGIIWLANNTNYNYPPGFAYILWLVNKTYALFLNPYNINQYWLDNNYLYLLIFKLITIISDIGIFYLIIKISEKFKFRWGKLLATFYLLNFVTVFDGVIWGQVDQFGVFLLLISVYLLIIDRPFRGAVFFTIACLMKMQNIIFIPIFFLFVFKKFELKGLIRSTIFSFITFAVITIPFWTGHQMASLVRLFTINSDWFPWLSLNAFNGWWIYSGLNGMALSDKTLFFGIINAKQFGLLIFSFVYFIICLRLFLSKKEDLLKDFVLSLATATFAFFHLLTQSHERYLFPLLGLIPVLFIVRKDKNVSSSLVFFLTLSLGIFANMYISCAMNYKDQVYWPFSAEITRTLTLYVSIFQIIVFMYFIIKYYFQWIKKYWYYVILSVMLLVSIIMMKNIKYYLGESINLDEIKDISHSQDYLEPVFNMTVESSRSSLSWNRLSNNYFFYDKGIGAHANSEINYSLKGKFSTFETDFGIDTEGTEANKAYFIILGDGRELYRSKPMGKFDVPGTVKVNITNVDILSLRIIKAQNSIVGLHADWLDPVLTK
ncbi:MAG: NPCBM/NEW2 domain-containing protein [Actinobacteria bacterium]|nr:NPCBM/NEW2 domain-containing protein [Actinomycetota bacterium]